MEKKQKIDWSGFLIMALLILLFCFGGFMFAISVGSDGVAKLFVLIGAIIGAFVLLAKFLPNTVMPFFYVLSCTVVLYAFGGLRLIYYIVGIPVIVLVYWGIYKIGDHFGWWKPASWNK